MPGCNFHAGRVRLLAIAGCLCLFGSLWASAASRRAEITGIRYWSTSEYTRVAIDLQSEVRYSTARVSSPDRIFFDFHGVRLSPRLIGKTDHVIDEGFLRQIRVEQISGDTTRIVLNVSDASQYYAFFLPNPARLIIDVRGSAHGAKPVYTVNAPVGRKPVSTVHARVERRVVRRPRVSAIDIAAVKGIGLGPEVVGADRAGVPIDRTRNTTFARRSERTIENNAEFGSPKPALPKKAPPPQIVAFASSASTDVSPLKTRSKVDRSRMPAPKPVPAAVLPASGEPSMVRTLGLKINRIVIDAGHGGHDSGTLGPGGIEEKDVVLDVALRLGALLKQKLRADVIYTRSTDTFIPLETRTEIANKAHADLFISIHANSSSDSTVRGVETYYLNFTTSADALAVAARENAVSDQSIHQLSDLVKKIALQDKISESRTFASDVEQNLYDGLESGNPGLRDRGVKKAPFVVLIGANMPSILAEISFLTNPEDANELRRPKYRERIAEALYKGVAQYVDSLGGVRLADASPASSRKRSSASQQ
ncbi:MAG: N-acetylmuramoyl-L-alanine amidase [Acidobacteriaceae bacterium]